MPDRGPHTTPGSPHAALVRQVDDLAEDRIARNAEINRLREALREIVRVAEEPLDSMHSEKRTLRHRGQRMLDLAKEALRD